MRIFRQMEQYPLTRLGAERHEISHQVKRDANGTVKTIKEEYVEVFP